MLVLALDTTGDFGSIALVDGENTLEEVLLHAPQGFSHVLFGQIQALLDRHDRPLRDIDLYAAASGPGSFTGVRVGLSAVKGFAEVNVRPVIAISNLRALWSFGHHSLRAPVIDARRGEVYAALFKASGEAVVPEQVVRFQEFLEQLPDEEIEWISSDFAPFWSALPARTPVVTKAPRELASAVARLAVREYKAGLSTATEAGREAFTPEAIDANYVRRSDAEIFWKER